jgi:hypothetical protein
MSEHGFNVAYVEYPVNGIVQSQDIGRKKGRNSTHPLGHLNSF